MKKKPMPPFMTAKKDAAMDKKAGIKEGSKKDLALDKKRGLPAVVIAIGVKPKGKTSRSK